MGNVKLIVFNKFCFTTLKVNFILSALYPSKFCAYYVHAFVYVRLSIIRLSFIRSLDLYTQTPTIS